MKCADCSCIAFFESWGNFCCLPVHFAIGKICFCYNCSIHHTIGKKKYNAILFPLESKWNVQTFPLLLYSEVKAIICIDKILKPLLGFRVNIKDFLQDFPTIYITLHVTQRNCRNKFTNLFNYWIVCWVLQSFNNITINKTLECTAINQSPYPWNVRWTLNGSWI